MIVGGVVDVSKARTEMSSKWVSHYAGGTSDM